jgi:hypothetical protein
LIFLPGFSTADKITDVSGRGVGMDVVKKNIERIRGRVDIKSTPGQGSVFTIRIPLTLAIIQGMLVRVSNERYIVPLLSIRESFVAQKDWISTVVNRGEMIKIRGDLLPCSAFPACSERRARWRIPPRASLWSWRTGTIAPLFWWTNCSDNNKPSSNRWEKCSAIFAACQAPASCPTAAWVDLDVAGIVKLAHEG